MRILDTWHKFVSKKNTQIQFRVFKTVCLLRNCLPKKLLIKIRIAFFPKYLEMSYEVEKIVSHRLEKGQMQYRIRWRNYGEEHDTWQFLSKMQNCQKAIEEYAKTQPLPGQNVSDSFPWFVLSSFNIFLIGKY